MSGEEKDGSLCARVFDHLVDGDQAGLEADRVLTEHLGSCVTCFRTMTELRDAPRLSAALHGAAPNTVHPATGDRFWEELAVLTTAAAAAALEGHRSADRRPASEAGGRRWSVSLRARVAVFATAVAAATAFAVVARRPAAVFSAGTAAVHTPGGVASVGRSADDETGVAAADVADLDGTALRRLLDRLSARAPAGLTGYGASDSEAGEVSDTLGDDDRHVNDELADLDGAALRRVASSLAGSSL